VEEEKVALHENVIVSRIEPATAWLQQADYDPAHPFGGSPAGESYPVPARFVFALLGQHGDTEFLERLGLCLDGEGRPISAPETYETNVSGIYVSGSLAGAKIDVIVSGRDQTAAVVRRIAGRIRA
jgi:thioredoxin reductase